MPSNPVIIFRKKIYNSTTDAVNGVVVFDNTTGKIYVGGDCYSSEVLDTSLNSSTGVLTITKTDNTTYNCINNMQCNNTFTS